MDWLDLVSFVLILDNRPIISDRLLHRFIDLLMHDPLEQPGEYKVEEHTPKHYKKDADYNIHNHEAPFASDIFLDFLIDFFDVSELAANVRARRRRMGEAHAYSLEDIVCS